jgi:hypothetical protein
MALISPDGSTMRPILTLWKFEDPIRDLVAEFVKKPWLTLSDVDHPNDWSAERVYAKRLELALRLGPEHSPTVVP